MKSSVALENHASRDAVISRTTPECKARKKNDFAWVGRERCDGINLAPPVAILSLTSSYPVAHSPRELSP